MSATKDKKNCSRGFAKTGKGQGFLDISVKVVDCYSNFDFVVAKWKVFCMYAIIISPWVRDFLARQVKRIPVIFWIVLGPGQNDHYGPIQNDQLKSIKSGQRISWLNGLF